MQVRLKECFAAAGPEQAVHWLSEHEPDAGSAEVAAVATSTPQKPPAASLRPQGAGVAGILRREAQLAARNDE